MPPADALAFVTSQPARQLGIAGRVGSLEIGKDGDLVVWSGDPFSVYSKAEVVVIGGEVAYRRADGKPATDHELGNSARDHQGVTP